VHKADEAGDMHSHEANKVAQYITLGLDPDLRWTDKLRYFTHAIKRHCIPPALPDDEVWMFYRSLADMVRTYAGQEALRLASTEDDQYASRLAAGTSREQIEEDAEAFFLNLMGNSTECPDHFHDDDWHQLKLIRDQWI
jgi:hypothetical protein